jgi:hypothetical protein
MIMLLHIHVDKSKDCPENIDYNISFHKTLDELGKLSLQPVWTKW